MKTGVLGGEGLVCRFSGQGRLWLQSREFYNLINYLNVFRPVQTTTSSDSGSGE
ncbi:MAG: AIM24 family protein [Scytonematopsis contorta HA4267-MV1]|nr:AIM24 family protein [Scytonematopsis contorta HA4267-MV1]